MGQLRVETGAGPVMGEARDGVRRWLGIPFAQAERFGAPRPPVPWNGVRDATKLGPQSPQMFGNNPRRAMIRQDGFDEDCLVLNVYAPEDIGDEPGDEPRPVYVWIHGGAFVGGSGNPYDGSAMARTHGVVVVTINYRLGVLGWVNFGEVLGLPELPSNLGLRDQVAALEWVRDTIARFGGDPARVTIGGESAGSMSVSLLMLHKPAWGLFHGAVMQSVAVSLIHGREKSRAIARRYAELLDLDQGSLEKMRSVPLEALFAAQAKVGAENPAGTPAAPWFDDDALPADLAAAHAAETAPVPLIAGANRDEVRLFEIMPGEILPTRWPQLEALLTDQLGPDHAARVLASYSRTTQGRRALATDLVFAMPTRHFAQRHSVHQPTWFYRFDYAHPIAGATHALELTLMWPMRGWLAAAARGGPMKGFRAALGERMVAHWAHFIRHGTPAADWPAHCSSDWPVKVFDLEDRVEANPQAERVTAWARRDVGPGI
jgi:para-nitrobenzyl esterase